MASGIGNYFSKGKGAVLPGEKKGVGGWVYQFRHCKKDLLCCFCVYASDALAVVPRFV